MNYFEGSFACTDNYGCFLFFSTAFLINLRPRSIVNGSVNNAMKSVRTYQLHVLSLSNYRNRLITIGYCMIINNNVLIESIVASDANFTSDISADLKKMKNYMQTFSRMIRLDVISFLSKSGYPSLPHSRPSNQLFIFSHLHVSFT